MGLTIEEHRMITQHLHAVDRHLQKVVEMMVPGDGTTKAPIELIETVEELRDRIGGASSPSRHSINDLVDRFQTLLFSEWQGATFDVYYGSDADCVMLQLDAPYKPPK